MNVLIVSYFQEIDLLGYQFSETIIHVIHCSYSQKFTWCHTPVKLAPKPGNDCSGKQASYSLFQLLTISCTVSANLKYVVRKLNATACNSGSH